MKGEKRISYDIKGSGKRIKEMRKKNGYTQESFAKEIGISHRTYSGIESGAHGTSIDTLLEISRVLNVSTDCILAGKPDTGMLSGVPEEKRELAERILKGILENL